MIANIEYLDTYVFMYIWNVSN